MGGITFAFLNSFYRKLGIGGYLIKLFALQSVKYCQLV